MIVFFFVLNKCLEISLRRPDMWFIVFECGRERWGYMVSMFWNSKFRVCFCIPSVDLDDLFCKLKITTCQLYACLLARGRGEGRGRVKASHWIASCQLCTTLGKTVTHIAHSCRWRWRTVLLRMLLNVDTCHPSTHHHTRRNRCLVQSWNIVHCWSTNCLIHNCCT